MLMGPGLKGKKRQRLTSAYVKNNLYTYVSSAGSFSKILTAMRLAFPETVLQMSIHSPCQTDAPPVTRLERQDGTTTKRMRNRTIGLPVLRKNHTPSGYEGVQKLLLCHLYQHVCDVTLVQ